LLGGSGKTLSWFHWTPSKFVVQGRPLGPSRETKPTTMKSKYLTHTVLLISMTALSSSVFAQNEPVRPGVTGNQPSLTEDKASTVQPGSLTTVIADSATFSTLTQALKATGLDKTLGGRDQFTIFAPTDEAFGKLPEGLLTKLMLPENQEKLRMLLLYHVVAGRVLAAEMTDGDVKTVNGEKLDVDVSADQVEVEGSKIYKSDVSATNGVMHSIGTVLVPKSLDGFAGLKN
jgi:uncharacterized surface protein with fasciclin (FAS1) repeats